jgi:hypothetical protein
MVERQADPGHVKPTLPSVNRLNEILTAKLDWTAKRSKRPLCDVQRWLGNVDADVATDASASERCGRPGRSAAGEIGEDKALFRLVQKNFVKRDVDLVMAVVTGGYQLLPSRQTLRKQFLIGRHGCPSRRTHVFTDLRVHEDVNSRNLETSNIKLRYIRRRPSPVTP